MKTKSKIHNTRKPRNRYRMSAFMVEAHALAKDAKMEYGGDYKAYLAYFMRIENNPVTNPRMQRDYMLYGFCTKCGSVDGCDCGRPSSNQPVN